MLIVQPGGRSPRPEVSGAGGGNQMHAGSGNKANNNLKQLFL